jgi:UDP-N-acetylglucosamine 2-epimerase (hydrolysing)
MAEVKARYAIPFDDYGIVIFHPVTSEVDTMGAQAQSLFACLEASGKNFVVIAPNNDPGTDDIFAVIEALPKDRFRLIPSMRFNYFSELMKNAAVMVGNSSAGVREAPFLGLPSLDVGSRQNNRAQAASIVNTSALDQQTIINFIAKRWHLNASINHDFGSGQSAKQFTEVLQSLDFWRLDQQKTFVETVS